MRGIVERLKDKGVTLTPQRMALAEFLSKNKDHPTADEIQRAIGRRYPTMSVATVYSTPVLTKTGATWIAIFALFAGFVQGFGGIEYILHSIYRYVGRQKVNMSQIPVLASMGFGGMSGSVPTMKHFGVPPPHAESSLQYPLS